MKSTKSAVLFYGKNKVPTPFDDYKQYDIGTGYVALYEQDDSTCVLCRMLDDVEVPSYLSNSHKLVLKSDDYNGFKEVSVIIITTQLHSLEDADKLVNKYKY